MGLAIVYGQPHFIAFIPDLPGMLPEFPYPLCPIGIRYIQGTF